MLGFSHIYKLASKYTIKDGCKMQRTIRNGITIISTGKTEGITPFNKWGEYGIAWEEKDKSFKVGMQYKYRKFHIGSFKELETAKKARRVAQYKVEDGTFPEWHKTKPHARSFAFMPFWEAEFKKYGL
jgi:hypothetical protein